MVTWDMVPPIDQNGVITMYEVLYEPQETFNGSIMSTTTRVDGTAMAVNLTGLEEYVNYTISVRAYTSAGEGPYSNGTIELTNEDGKKLNNYIQQLLAWMMFNSPVPATPPTNVMAMATSPRSITVMWEEVVPIDQNGVITMYQVLYQPLETFGGAIGPLTVNVTELTADLTDLEEYVNYTISVRAYSSVGEGPYSDVVIELTDEDSEFQAMTVQVWMYMVEPPGCWYTH